MKVEKCVVMKDASADRYRDMKDASAYTDRYRDMKDASTATQHAHVQGSRQFSAGPSPVLRMTSMEDHSIYMADRILRLTLEIMFLLTGEDYTIVKNICADHKSSSSRRTEAGFRRVDKELDPISKTEKKEILHLTNQIIQLLTDEVPARCQDVAVYFSIEEWDYVEKHKNLYKNIIPDDPLSSQDGKPVLTPKHEIEEPVNGLNPTSIKCVTVGDCLSSELSNQEPTSAAGMDRGDGTAQEPLSCSEHGALPALTPKHEIEVKIEDDFTEEPVNKLTATAITSRTGGDCVPSELSKQEPMSAASTDRGTGTAQEPCSERGKCFTFRSGLTAPKHAHTDIKPFSCPECSKSFKKKGQLVRHIRIHTGEEQCPICGKCFTHRSKLIDHQRTHTGERPFVCHHCGKNFAYKLTLTRHQRLHTGEKLLCCSECGKCFVQKADLWRHQRTHMRRQRELPILTPKHEIEVEIEDDFTEEPLNDLNTTTRKSPTGGDCVSSEPSKREAMSAASTARGDGGGTAQEPLTCSECGKCFKFRSRLLAHECVHTGEKPFSCSECGKCFKFRSRVVAHERIHTGEKPFSCPECGKCFIRKSQLVQHTKIHTGAEQCSFCAKCFTQKSKLIQHERIHTGERPFFCHQCGQCFAQEATLMKHELIHTGEKPFSCSECGKRFMLKSYLRCHQRTHTGEKPFSCSYCHKGFTQKSHLSEHIKIHTGAKLFSCSECDKSFTQRSGLILHQRLHTGEKPFSCLECGKSFIKKAQLVQHRRIHTGEEQCATCGKCFTHKSKLIDHQRTHTGERPFSCHQCQKSFALKTTLARHQRLHKGEKLLCCSECGKCFMQKSDLFRHQRTHTGQQPL